MNLFELHMLMLAGAMVLECVWVEMRGVPHVVCGLGRFITVVEKMLYARSRWRGFTAVSLLLLSVGLISVVTLMVIWPWQYLFLMVGLLITYQVLAGSLLIKTGRDVFGFLEEGDLEGARERLTWLVGRDTKELSAQQVRKAALESMAENLSDGMIAPMFYFAVAGVPGLLLYKMINTLDSRFGYKNDRYREFGYCAAKLDDIVNYIPARITALLMVVSEPKHFVRGVQFVRRFGRAHLSPNAGYPEAALAGILNCRFGGSHKYSGVLVEKDWIGNEERPFGFEDVEVAGRVSKRASWLFLVIILSVWFCVGSYF